MCLTIDYNLHLFCASKLSYTSPPSLSLLHAGSSLSFAARPKYLSTSGEWVNVRWKYVDEPSENDWIGVFTPPIDDVYPINPSQQAPIKWKVNTLSHTTTYLQHSDQNFCLGHSQNLLSGHSFLLYKAFRTTIELLNLISGHSL